MRENQQLVEIFCNDFILFSFFFLNFNFCKRFLTGQVDSRTIQKFQDEAKSMNRDSWFYAYIMDTNIEERQKVS